MQQSYLFFHQPLCGKEIEMSTSENYTILNLGELVCQYQESFNDLGPDDYHPAENGGRTRRLGQYHARYDLKTGCTVISKLKTQPFLQGETNKLTGHIRRPFHRVEVDLKPYITHGFAEVNKMWPLSGYGDEWLINCHQIRVHAAQAYEGIPVPEGVHKDGAEFVIMACVARDGVKGGISHIYEDENKPPVFGTTLMPGQAIMVNDKEVFHMVSPLIGVGSHGYRDMILMGFHLWSHGKYAGDWTKNIEELQEETYSS
jgi:hypothetical protein